MAIENVLVKIDTFTFPMDFMTWGIEGDLQNSHILRRLLPSSSQAWIDINKEELTLLVGDEKAKFNVATPEPGSTRLASPNQNPENARLILFIYILFRFLFKSVEARIPGITRRADQNRSPVYSDVFNYLIKTFSLCYFSLGFRFEQKHFQMEGA